jgi:CHAT domain-containing protein/Tfp pilus assembly protein PilF
MNHSGLVIVRAFCCTVLLLLAGPLASGQDDEATSPDALFDLLDQGKYDEVQASARALLAAEEEDADDARTAEILDALVESLWRSGKAQDPETRELAERAVALKEGALGPDHAGMASSLNNLAILDFFTGQYSDAKPLWERALEIRETTLGPDDPAVAQSMNNLANLLQTIGDYEGARSLYERSLAIREKVLDPEHPRLADSMNNLGVLLRNMGDFSASRPLIEKALELKTKSLGPDHPKVASSANALGNVLWEMGDRERARTLFQQAQAVWEKALGPDHPSLGASLNNLGELLRNAGEFEDALPLYERSLAIYEGAYGPEHPSVALCLDNFADLLEAMGNRARAKSYYERAATIRENALGPQHPDLAESLSSLGALLADEGDTDQARSMLDRAISIQQTSLGPNHPFVSESMVYLATVLANSDQATEALGVALESERIGRDHLRLTGRSLSEREALRYAAVRSSGLDLALALAAEGPEKADPGAVLDGLIRSRAVVLDEMAARHASVSSSGDPRVEQFIQRLASTRARLANLTVRGLGRMTPEEYREQLEEARAEKEQAEGELAAVSADFADEQQKAQIGLEEVAASVPPGSALVSYAQYQGSDGDPAYLALVLPKRGAKTRVVTLGSAKQIEELVAGWKKEAAGGMRARGRDPEVSEAAYREVGEQLRKVVWDPLANGLEEAERVFITPDGVLNLVSFASLPVGDERYLVEAGPLLHYLSAERDLVPTSRSGKQGHGLLAVGGPDYDIRLSGESRASSGESSGESVASTTRSSCGSFDELKFAPLPAAALEAGEIVELWKQGGPELGPAQHLSGAEASETALKKALEGRRVLHLATHGFFLGGDCGGGEATRGFKVVTKSAPKRFDFTGFSPLLLSGLAMAGANHRRDAGIDQDDGVLTAEEIAGLDLGGVEWAVLSACDTGVGEIQAGEGVFGLRRAVQVAGVQTLIMSLWPVDDEATRQWMQGLYRARLTGGKDSSESVREAGLHVLSERRGEGQSTHPFYWAAFVAAGNWK